MTLKTLLLLKLVCCGGPLLVLVLSSVGLSGVIAVLAGASWYLVGIVGALAGVLLWRFGRRRFSSCLGRPETQVQAERIFGDRLPANRLPASRRRSSVPKDAARTSSQSSPS